MIKEEKGYLIKEWQKVTASRYKKLKVETHRIQILKMERLKRRMSKRLKKRI